MAVSQKNGAQGSNEKSTKSNPLAMKSFRRISKNKPLTS
jgi:hypothetical protein